MPEAFGKVVPKEFASSGFTRPAVVLDNGEWYWLNKPAGPSWGADPGQRVRVRYVEGEQFCDLVGRVAVATGKDLIGKHVVMDGRKEKVVDAGEERTDHKGFRVIRVELASGRVCDLLVPVECLEEASDLGRE